MNERLIYFTASNSTWIADDQPCITYGLRGVVHSVLEVSGVLRDPSAVVDIRLRLLVMDLIYILASTVVLWLNL
jgi:di- and tripeptidase